MRLLARLVCNPWQAELIERSVSLPHREEHVDEYLRRINTANVPKGLLATLELLQNDEPGLNLVATIEELLLRLRVVRRSAYDAVSHYEGDPHP